MDFIHSERNKFGNRIINHDSKKKKIILSSIISIIVVILITIAIIITILLIRNKKLPKDHNNDDKGKETIDIEKPPRDDDSEPVKKPLSKEFEINTNVGDIKRISIVQISQDETKLNDNILKTEIKRKTIYDIYIISEEDSDEENKLFYSKIYNCSISIASECISTDGNDCEPKRFVDLNSEKKNKSENIRVLEDFKDIPIALCLFTITDNNFIMSMSCPESLSESKKNEIYLDLYFFRPPAIQRADKENDNITITIKNDTERNIKYIRETNGGVCNIYDSIGSHCTTDMNTTTDLEGNLLSYDELAITNITTDEKNSFFKIKLTKLIDISDKNPNLEPKKYKNSLDKLLPMLQTYMKDDILFTTDNFTDLYNLVQDKSKSKKKTYISKKTNKTYRNLMEYVSSFIKEKSLFYYKDVGGIQINLFLKADSGLNTQALTLI